MALLPTNYTIDAPASARPAFPKPLSFVKINDYPVPLRPILSFPWKFRRSFGKWLRLSIRIGPETAPQSQNPNNPRLPENDLSQNPNKPRLPENDQVASPLFARLPAEIRLKIYALLLVSTDPIKSPHLLFPTEPVLLLNDRHRVPNMDATFLRTCQKIYSEAMPVLYGENTFAFSSPNGLQQFARGNVQKLSAAAIRADPTTRAIIQLLGSVFNFRLTPAGRFQLIRNLQVRFAMSDYVHRTPHPPRPHRSDLVHTWFWLLKDRNGASVWASFPALETLMLDFSDWGLGQDEALISKLFVGKFRVRGKGLKKLIIKGVGHQQTLDQLKAGLLEEGGKFEVLP